MAVLDPRKVVYKLGSDPPELDVAHHPKRPELGSRVIPFGRELYIDRSDFEPEPPEGFFQACSRRERALEVWFHCRF